MERSEGEIVDFSKNDSTIISTSEETSCQPRQIFVNHGAEIVCYSSTKTLGDQCSEIPVDPCAQTDVDSPALSDKAISEKSPEKKEDMNKSQDEPPHELENQFILRLPPEHAFTVRSMMHSGRVTMKDKIKIDLSPDGRHAVVEVGDASLSAKLVDLPCVVGSLKTIDKKNFYKTADISQMLVCSADDDLHSSLEEPVSLTKNKERVIEQSYIWKHGITPPLKNVRKNRFRKIKKKLTDFKQIEEVSFTEEKGIPAIHRVLNDTIDISSHTLLQYTQSPYVENEVKRLLCEDAEAVSVRWEIIADDEIKEIESQGCIPGLPVSPGMSGSKPGDTSEYDMLQVMTSDSSSNTHNEDENEEQEDEDDEEEEEDEDLEETLERELQAKIFEYGQHETKEGASSIVMEIQKHIYYKEKKLQEIQNKAQRQKNIMRKVENLALKNHLRSVLKNLSIQEKQRNDQIISLQEQLNHFLQK